MEKDKMGYYFAYGSNLHHLQMARRCPNCKFIKKITLNNYKLTFRINVDGCKHGYKHGVADVEKEKGQKVYGALFVISEPAERRLDVAEDYPKLYKKLYFEYDNKKVMTYIMPKKTELFLPTTRYLNIIKQGYKDCKIDIKHLNLALSDIGRII